MGFFVFGAFVGCMGTLIGVGGGFLIVPALLYLFPEMSASQVTAASLFCVSLNAISGTTFYAINKQVHFRAGLVFALASLPGAWAGVHLNELTNREHFEIYYAFLLLLIGFYLFIKNRNAAHHAHGYHVEMTSKKYAIGITSSFFVGFIASFFGVGGGIIHMPILHQVLGFPVHLATATSHFILAITSITAVIEHYHDGSLDLSQTFLLQMGIGMVVGAQVGGQLSRRTKPQVIIKILSFTIIAIALRIFYKRLF
jgi:uncharacterized membrane protein YfcA